MVQVLPEQDQDSEELSSPDIGDYAATTHSQEPQIDQTVKGERNQSIGQMTGGTAICNVQGAVFNISGSNITTLCGEGGIDYHEAPNQVRIIQNHPTV